MIWSLVVVGVLVAAWIVLNLPRRRPDGEQLTRIHPYRRMLAFVMPRRNESVVYYDDYVMAEELLSFIERCREKFHVDVTHCLVAAARLGLEAVPSMNRFVAGQRLYQRNHVAITFSMKRKKMDRRAKLAAVKLRIPKEWSFEDLCREINARIRVERSDVETYSDKELGVFFKLPRVLVRWAMTSVRWADYHNLVPASFIENDGFFTSVFIANLGSLGMDPGYHHLYEYGTCPLFMMVGRIRERPWVVDGKVEIRKVLHIRYSYDERIDDGLTSKDGIEWVRKGLESPEEHLGRVEDFQKVEGGEEPGEA